jgi:hypothetical protein
MAVEYLPESADWPIELPSDHGLRGRVLVARDRGGVEQARWLNRGESC